jgi:(R)-amidase
MSVLRVRLIQTTLVDGDIAENLDKVVNTIAASEGKTDLLVFPETCISGFPTATNVSELAEHIDGSSITAVRAAARDAGVSVAIGFAENENGQYFNTALLIDACGEIVLRYRKTCLYDSDQDVFNPGDSFPVCDWRGIRIGLLICFDIEFPVPAYKLACQEADLILLVDGMMHPYGYMHRNAIPVRALDSQAYVVMANRVGAGEQYQFSGESHVADPFGKTIALGNSHSEAIIDVELDFAQTRHARAAAKDLPGYRLIKTDPQHLLPSHRD